MKLNLIFFVMDVLTILAYPAVFVYGKLHQYLRTKDSIHRTYLLLIDPVALER
jgi:hypothetical protein